MKRVLLLVILLGGVIAVLRLLPGGLRERLSQRRERMMGRMGERLSQRREHMMGRMGERFSTMMQRLPDESPPKVIMSGIRRMQEHNEQLLALLREQNDLLRERLPVQESSSPKSSASRAEPQQD